MSGANDNPCLRLGVVTPLVIVVKRRKCPKTLWVFAIQLKLFSEILSYSRLNLKRLAAVSSAMQIEIITPVWRDLLISSSIPARRVFLKKDEPEALTAGWSAGTHEIAKH